MLQFLNENTLRLAAAAAVAGTSDVDGAAIDTADGIDITLFATIGTANSGNYLVVEQDDESSFSGADVLSGAKAIALVSGNIVAVNVYRPTKRYVRGVIKRGASTATGDMYCIQGGLRTLPADNLVASKIDGVAVVSPPAV